MSTWPLVKFVDAPSATAAVGFDCNDRHATPFREVAAFDPGVPALEGDPDAVGQQWGFRSPSLTVRIKGTKQAAGAALNALSREQLQRSNWLMFQLSADTQPLWFKTYRTGYQPLSLERVYVDRTSGGRAVMADTWEVTVPLVAEPFAYGARQTIASATITQAPSGTNPMRLVLPAIKGDAPTGLRVAITPTGSAGYGQWLVGCLSGKSTMADTVINIGGADGFTAGTGTGASVSNAAYFGGNYRQVAIDTTLDIRLSGSLPAQPPGRYKVLVRCEVNNGAATDQVNRFAFGVGPPSVAAALYKYQTTAEIKVSGPGTRQGWVDLGEFTLPAGLTVPDDVTGTSPTVGFGLKIASASGTSTGRLEAFKLIPVDGPTAPSVTLLRTALPDLSTGNVATLDADTEKLWLKTTGGTFVVPTTFPAQVGAFPIADPAADQNLLIVLAYGSGAIGVAQAATTGTASLNATATADVSYHPATFTSATAHDRSS